MATACEENPKLGKKWPAVEEMSEVIAKVINLKERNVIETHPLVRVRYA